VRAKLTKRLVESTTAKDKAVVIYDTEIAGFHCRISSSGKRVYALYYRTRSGRQRRPTIGPHGPLTCEQARLIARNWLVDVANGGDPSANRIAARRAPIMADLADRYLKEHAIPNKKPSSVDRDVGLLRLWILPNLGQIKVAELTRADIYGLRNKMSHRPTSANLALALLSKMMNLAEAWALRPDGSNPVRHVDKYRTKKRQRYLSPAELVRVAEALDAVEADGSEFPSAIPALRLLILTGCRLGEILNLRWAEVDLQERCLRLADSKTGDKLVYLSQSALKVLQRIPRSPDTAYVIFGRRPAKHLVEIRRVWYRVRSLACIDDVRIHDLRHTYASVGVSAGLSLPIIGGLLGHSQPQTTARYAHLYADPIRAATELIGDRLAALMAANRIDVDGNKEEQPNLG
jgi:integrase